jgi:hypothetical protein
MNTFLSKAVCSLGKTMRKIMETEYMASHIEGMASRFDRLAHKLRERAAYMRGASSFENASSIVSECISDVMWTSANAQLENLVNHLGRARARSE